jgi:hypothetical protein
MTHENLGIQPDSNQHREPKNHLPNNPEIHRLTQDLTHQMTHGSARRKLAEMSVLTGVSMNCGKNSFSLFLPLFYTAGFAGQKQAHILTAMPVAARKLFFYYMALKTDAL